MSIFGKRKLKSEPVMELECQDKTVIDMWNPDGLAHIDKATGRCAATCKYLGDVNGQRGCTLKNGVCRWEKTEFAGTNRNGSQLMDPEKLIRIERVGGSNEKEFDGLASIHMPPIAGLEKQMSETSFPDYISISPCVDHDGNALLDVLLMHSCSVEGDAIGKLRYCGIAVLDTDTSKLDNWRVFPLEYIEHGGYHALIPGSTEYYGFQNAFAVVFHLDFASPEGELIIPYFQTHSMEEIETNHECSEEERQIGDLCLKTGLLGLREENDAVHGYLTDFGRAIYREAQEIGSGKADTE